MYHIEGDTMTEHSIEWTDGGKDVTVMARNGALYVTLETDDVSLDEERADLETVKGRDCLNAGTHRDDNGERFRALITIGDRWDEIEQLREDSTPDQTDDPLVYVVEEYEKEVGIDWTKTVTKQQLVSSKSWETMTDRQRELDRRVDAEHDVPEGAEPGDEFGLDDLLDDPRTRDERDQDALDEAAESGEEVTVDEHSADCNDPTKECSTDIVRRVATPDGEVGTRRTHTH